MAPMIGRNRRPDGGVTRPMPSERPARAAVAIILLALAAACGGPVTSEPRSGSPTASRIEAPSTTPAATTAAPLVVVEARGGECPQGACGGTTVVERDGRVHTTTPARQELGVVPPEVLQALIVEVDQADFEAVAGRPFTGECPVNFDGQERIYTFGTGGGQVRLASCEVEIDPDDPLFVAVDAAIAAAAP